MQAYNDKNKDLVLIQLLKIQWDSQTIDVSFAPITQDNDNDSNKFYLRDIT